jgi:hypothetical protein
MRNVPSAPRKNLNSRWKSPRNPIPRLASEAASGEVYFGDSSKDGAFVRMDQALCQRIQSGAIRL